ncbi:hypothetical protein NNJEOMEG_03411 [Fundidesulfovibrio magnetotacticus]|uniref:EcsC protein family n=1 Tax=Fundidesulfovibrio magnetotacticus TaxID=2730080 RepID=A0A6V8M4Y1_9BACT|nr:hypothetical protein NNJEOMEG_03411 [Fundidesulfovibrio magnetotacticus]
MVDRGIHGLPPLVSSWELAVRYLSDQSFADNHARVEALIRRESAKNAFLSAVSNVGGLATLPVAIPLGAYASFAYQARLAAAVALVYGHDVRSERVRVLVGLSMAGRRAVDILKQLGVRFTTMLLERAAAQLSEKVLAEAASGVGVRVLAQGGARLPGLLAKSVPVASAVVCGAIDWRYCRSVGRVARDIFARQ